MPGAEWFTPIASQKIKEHFWQKLEDSSPKAAPVGLEKTITYFNNNKKDEHFQQYDRFFASSRMFPLWDPRKTKENERYLPDIRENIYYEEKDKPVPVLSSMIYGSRIKSAYDRTGAEYRRINIMKDVKSRSGVFIKEERKPM
ncbi:uncharacterized protein LOC130901643 [Diorhabda carinulata]|uniref:uncharacterized protein LOC130901643 n=1 Tax=Diorhabda carinulata TaxID=1163345 RepID=UPI0025A10578|nr:uncharacterized protein LOC130901643 [Diorhabda carinulata]